MKLMIIDKYIAKQLIMPFFFGVAAFTSLFLGTDVLYRLAQMAIQVGIPVNTMLNIFIASLPGILVLTFPMSMLLAVILTYSRLSSNYEVIAMLASGFNVKRLIIPALIVALIVVIFTIFMNEAIVPQANMFRNRLTMEAMGEELLTTQKNLVIREFNGDSLSRLIYAEEFDGKTSVLKTVTIQDFKDGHLLRITKAERAIWTDGSWEFENGVVYTFDSDNRIYSVRFQKQHIDLPGEPEQIAQSEKRLEELSSTELRQRIDMIERQGGSAAPIRVELAMRYSIPFAAFIFALLGASLSIEPKRSGLSFGFGLSIMIILLYYLVTSIGITLGQEDKIPPLLGAWSSNVIFGILGIGLISKASK